MLMCIWMHTQRLIYILMYIYVYIHTVNIIHICNCVIYIYIYMYTYTHTVLYMHLYRVPAVCRDIPTMCRCYTSPEITTMPRWKHQCDIISLAAPLSPPGCGALPKSIHRLWQMPDALKAKVTLRVRADPSVRPSVPPSLPPQAAARFRLHSEWGQLDSLCHRPGGEKREKNPLVFNPLSTLFLFLFHCFKYLNFSQARRSTLRMYTFTAKPTDKLSVCLCLHCLRVREWNTDSVIMTKRSNSWCFSSFRFRFHYSCAACRTQLVNHNAQAH